MSLRRYVPAIKRTAYGVLKQVARNPVAQYTAGQVVKNVIDRGVKYATGNSGTSNSKNKDSTLLESRNYNIRNTNYRRTRRGKRAKKKARAMKKFRRKVLAAVNGKKGKKNATFTEQFNFVDNANNGLAANEMQMAAFTVAGVQVGGLRGADDLKEICTRDGMTVDTAKIHLHSWYSRCILRNTNGSQKYVTVYEVTNKRNIAYEDSETQLDGQFWRDMADMGAQPAGYQAWTSNETNPDVYTFSWNLTPFHNTKFMRNYTILNKKEFVMATGDQVSWESRSQKPFYYDCGKYETYSMIKPTVAYLICVRGAPTNSDFAAAITDDANNWLNVKWERSYWYTRDTAGENSEMDDATGIN